MNSLAWRQREKHRFKNIRIIGKRPPFEINQTGQTPTFQSDSEICDVSSVGDQNESGRISSDGTMVLLNLKQVDDPVQKVSNIIETVLIRN